MIKKDAFIQLGNYSAILRKIAGILVLFLLVASCSSDSKPVVAEEVDTDNDINPDAEDPIPEDPVDDSFLLSAIDLNNWKVTLPEGNNGKPIEVEPPEILNYRTNNVLRPYMYNDSTDGALVFYTVPGSSTPNSTYSRTELREQMMPGSNSENWTFLEGGRMKGTLAVPSISKDNEGKYHRTIVMQIHGRLTNAQRDLIGEDDNNAPPMLKIYWEKGKVRVKTKVLKDPDATDEEILHTDAWTDDEGHTFNEEVGTNTFTLEVVASEGRLQVTLNEEETVVYDDINLEKWGVFENYFKAGNYLQTKDEEGHALVKYYELTVSH